MTIVILKKYFMVYLIEIKRCSNMKKNFFFQIAHKFLDCISNFSIWSEGLIKCNTTFAMQKNRRNFISIVNGALSHSFIQPSKYYYLKKRQTNKRKSCSSHSRKWMHLFHTNDFLFVYRFCASAFYLFSMAQHDKLSGENCKII